VRLDKGLERGFIDVFAEQRRANERDMQLRIAQRRFQQHMLSLPMCETAERTDDERIARKTQAFAQHRLRGVVMPAKGRLGYAVEYDIDTFGRHLRQFRERRGRCRGVGDDMIERELAEPFDRHALRPPKMLAADDIAQMPNHGSARNDARNRADDHRALRIGIDDIDIARAPDRLANERSDATQRAQLRCPLFRHAAQP